MLGLQVDVTGFYMLAEKNLLHLEEKPPYEKIKELTSLWQPYAGFVYFHLLLDNSPFAQILGGFKELLSQTVGFCTVWTSTEPHLAKGFNFKLKHVCQVGKERHFRSVFLTQSGGCNSFYALKYKRTVSDKLEKQGILSQA